LRRDHFNLLLECSNNLVVRKSTHVVKRVSEMNTIGAISIYEIKIYECLPI
jgi:hypothetical protein